MTTLVYVELEPATGAMRYASAGHPPPLIVSGAGATRLLWGARSAPLGSSFKANRVESINRLQDGERLVLYTDGLIERRFEAIDAGLDRLVRATQHDVAGNDFVERLCNEMSNGPAGDDICVLTVALVRAGSFAAFVAPKPHELSKLRRQLRTWLDSAGCDPELVADIVLATSEAASNAIEHGAAETQRGVSIVGRVADDTISVVIRDHGRWREPGPPSNRGRGLMIMRHLMDRVSVEPGDEGTVVRLERALN
jgi:serine/threonine-protein kinase RsbW